MKLLTPPLLACLFLAGAISANFVFAANLDDIVINEIAWMGTTASYNDEWIELKNNTNQEINLDGWILKATDGTPEIKLAKSLLANGFYLLERSKNYTGALENNGEILELYGNLGNLIDSVDASSGWPAGDNLTKQTMEKSLSVSNTDSWQTSQDPSGTPGKENGSLTTTEVAEARPPQAQELIKYPAGVVINEILPSPIGPDEEEEWIEIFNKNNSEVDISGWQITDKEGSVKAHTFPEGSIIGPNSFLVLLRPTTKITLNNQGDGLKLIQPDGSALDEISYQNAPRGESYGLFDSGWVWTSAPTPGTANIVLAPTPKLEKKVAENGSPQTLAAVGEVMPKHSNASPIILAAIFTSLFSGVIILLLKRYVRT